MTQKTLQAEVISIGDELTSGQRLDTNTRWLSTELGELGIATVRHTTVGDDLAANIDALRSAAGRADLIICTGGLGPTLDDLTRQAMAEAFDRPLELDAASLEHIQAMFARRQRPMPERNRLQAMFPRGSRAIPNPHGSAPGVDLSVEVDGRLRRLFALPGVPAEMKQMWTETVVPRIEQMQAGRAGRLRHHALKLFGIGESDVEARLPDLIDRGRQPTVGITVSRATITLRIAARAVDDAEFNRLIAPTIEEIHAALPGLIFGEGTDELEHAVLRELSRQALTMASLEVGAASWISDWMLQAELPNPSAGGDESLAGPGYYMGGAAFPTIVAAERWLAGAATIDLADGVDSVSSLEEIWCGLARQTRHRFRSDVGLAVGCYPSQTAMQLEAAAFDCFIAIAGPGDERIEYTHLNFGGHPDVLGPRMAKTGLDRLRKHLS